MSRHIYLRYDGHEAILRILYNVAVLCLRVKTTLATTYLRAAAMFGEVGPRLNFNSPALVIGKVQVKYIHLIRTDEVDESLDIIHAEKMPAYIEHRSPETV